MCWRLLTKVDKTQLSTKRKGQVQINKMQYTV